MPNLGAVLKEEIARLSRRQIRSQIGSMKKASAQHRRHIAALKRHVAKLERQVTVLSGRVLRRPAAAPAEAQGKSIRFVPKGLRSHRARIGLSAAEYGKLLGVSSQSIYNWERGTASPRQSQLATLASLRTMGKREAMARLEQLAAAAPAKKAAQNKAD